MLIDIEKMSPREIVAELDRYIIGQDSAKKAVAVALRNRLRRKLLSPELREEVSPKNIMMIGPTGVGKTEIARRLTKISGAPFIKVEATKFTEVGYVGRDVESMVRDLMANAIAIIKKEQFSIIKDDAMHRCDERLLDLLLPGTDDAINASTDRVDGDALATRESFRKKLKAGQLDDKTIEMPVASSAASSLTGIEIFGAKQGMDEMDMTSLTHQLGSMFGNKKKRELTIKQARHIILAEENEKLIDQELVKERAKERVEQMGIIFIDEIDKIASRGQKGGGPDVSREGVQRDILPIIEGSIVNTKYGSIDTTYILFIAAGAFNMSKPSDLIPELQGRFPIKVELEAMTADIFEQILTKPKNALIYQYTELLKTEQVSLSFTDDAIRAIAQQSADLNSSLQNIGARRLHNVLESVLEEISFKACEMAGQTVIIDLDYVTQKFKMNKENEDLNRYIL